MKEQMKQETGTKVHFKDLIPYRQWMFFRKALAGVYLLPQFIKRSLRALAPFLAQSLEFY